jgi:hypothetical protein
VQEILERDGKPLFRITVSDDPGECARSLFASVYAFLTATENAIEGSTPGSAWDTVQGRLSDARCKCALRVCVLRVCERMLTRAACAQ